MLGMADDNTQVDRETVGNALLVVMKDLAEAAPEHSADGALQLAEAVKALAEARAWIFFPNQPH